MRGTRRIGTSPEYGTWIRFRAVVVFGVLTGVCLALSLLAFVSPWALVFLLPAGVFGWIFAIIVLARYRFSDAGGGYQARVHGLLQERVRGSDVLDIGCGNGHLAIQMALDDAGRQVTGLDFWGSAWEYSKGVCERNARLEGVGERVSFVQGSAAMLPFEDGRFDGVVSCLAFHEVRRVGGQDGVTVGGDASASAGRDVRVTGPVLGREGVPGAGVDRSANCRRWWDRAIGRVGIGGAGVAVSPGWEAVVEVRKGGCCDERVR